jgi:hypothetical protein
MFKYTFATAINCMDGRVQQPVIDWIRESYGVDYVDMITEPGPDGALAQGLAQTTESIRSRVRISVEVHGSNLVALVGHHDCAGNPVSKEQHLSQIQSGIEIIRSWGFAVAVLGLWIGDDWQVALVEPHGGD